MLTGMKTNVGSACHIEQTSIIRRLAERGPKIIVLIEEFQFPAESVSTRGN